MILAIEKRINLKKNCFIDTLLKIPQIYKSATRLPAGRQIYKYTQYTLSVQRLRLEPHFSEIFVKQNLFDSLQRRTGRSATLNRLRRF
jgi:hypothetical protein